jgi:molybdate transport system permease protein
MVNPVKAGFQNLPGTLKEASYTLGKGKLMTLFKVLIPNIKPALLSAVVMTFAHVVGEFGVVLMIGGNIPGQTQTASIAVYTQVEALNYSAAGVYSAVLFGFSFIVLVVFYFINRKNFNIF